MQAHPLDSHIVFAAAHTKSPGCTRLLGEVSIPFSCSQRPNQLQLLCIQDTWGVDQMSGNSTYLLEVVSDQLQLLRAEHEVLG